MSIGKIQLFTQDALRNGICDIVFIKTDGSKRTMKATLQKEVLKNMFDPEDIEKESIENSSEYVQRIVDLEINEWRSFCWDRLESVNGVLVEGI